MVCAFGAFLWCLASQWWQWSLGSCYLRAGVWRTGLEMPNQIGMRRVEAGSKIWPAFYASHAASEQFLLRGITHGPAGEGCSITIATWYAAVFKLALYGKIISTDGGTLRFLSESCIVQKWALFSYSVCSIKIVESNFPHSFFTYTRWSSPEAYHICSDFKCAWFHIRNQNIKVTVSLLCLS